MRTQRQRDVTLLALVLCQQDSDHALARLCCAFDTLAYDRIVRYGVSYAFRDALSERLLTAREVANGAQWTKVN